MRGSPRGPHVILTSMKVTRRGLIQSTALAAQAPRTAVTQSTYSESRLAQPAGGPLRVLSNVDFDAQEIQLLRAAAPGTEIVFEIAKGEEFDRKLREAEVVYGSINGRQLDLAPKLKWFQNGGAGMEGVDKRVMAASALTITNMARIFAPGIAETAIGLLLALTRGIGTFYRAQFYKREWKPVGTVRSADQVEISGRTVGIVGMGGIGSEIARRLHYGFNMKVLATDAKPMPKPEFVAELRDPSWFRTMVPQVDVLVSAAPQVPATLKMFNEDVFRSMKKTSYFLAMSRGGLYDDMALAKALKERWIAGAGLDVFPQEPVPSSHPFFDCDNVVMTPHTSGWSPDRQVRLVALFAENLRRYAAGMPLMNVVDKEKGY